MVSNVFLKHRNLAQMQGLQVLGRLHMHSKGMQVLGKPWLRSFPPQHSPAVRSHTRRHTHTHTHHNTQHTAPRHTYNTPAHSAQHKTPRTLNTHHTYILHTYNTPHITERERERERAHNIRHTTHDTQYTISPQPCLSLQPACAPPPKRYQLAACHGGAFSTGRMRRTGG